jgi:hypothetical protein
VDGDLQTAQDLGAPPYDGWQAYGGYGPVGGQPSDRPAWVLYLVLWALVCGAGAALTLLGEQRLIGGLIIGIFTLVGIAWKPTFGLCLLLAVFPLGRALGYGRVFSAERGVGILLFLGAALHFILRGRRFRFACPPTWALLALMFLGALTVAWARIPLLAASSTFTMFQILVLVAVVLSVVWHFPDLTWPFRCYVLACVLFGVFAPAMGLAIQETKKMGVRYTIGLSEEYRVDPNTLASMFSIAFFLAIFLFRRDPSRLLRIVWLLSALLLPVLMLMTGSRTGLIATFLTLLLPVLFLRQIARRPVVFVGAVVVLVLAGVLFFVALEYVLPLQTAQRLTDFDKLQRSAVVRLGFIGEAVAYAVRNPLGAGFQSFFIETMTVHNDFFYLLGSLGFAGALAYGVFGVAMLLNVRAMPVTWEKWLVRSLVLINLIFGLAYMQLFWKHFWIFMVLAWAMARQVRLEAREQAAYPGVEELEAPALA